MANGYQPQYNQPPTSKPKTPWGIIIAVFGCTGLMVLAFVGLIAISVLIQLGKQARLEQEQKAQQQEQH